MSGPELPEVLRDRLGTLTGRIRDAAQMVRDAHPDGVHDLRVAMRRTRSLLSTFRRQLDAEEGPRLREELRWAGGELSPVRDLEVVHERSSRC